MLSNTRHDRLQGVLSGGSEKSLKQLFSKILFWDIEFIL